MTAAWIAGGAGQFGAEFGAEIELALRATVLIGAAWAAAALLRRAGASAATRHMVWLLGIFALLALPFAWWLAPPLPLPILRAGSVVAAAAAMPATAAAAAPVTAGWPGWDALLLAAYLTGAAALLLRFAIFRLIVARLWRDAEPARDAAWRELLAQVSGEMRLRRKVALRIARGPAMPMTWGTVAPKVLLPAEAGAWPADQRRLVLLHELAHVARGDSFSRSAASLACALWWFHPAVWLAARRMRLEQECAADDRVLKAGAGPRHYALSLLDLAKRVGESRRPDHAAAMAGMCQLEQRLVSITADARRERAGPGFLYASAATAACVTLAVAAGVPVRPLSVLPDPIRIEAALMAARFAPVPAEAGTGAEAQAPQRDAMVSRTEGRPRNSGGAFEPSRAAAAPPRAEEGAAAVAAQPTAPAAQGQESEPLQEAPAPAPQRALYGPQLPRRDVEAQDFDPRIPEPLRRGGAGRGGDRESAAASMRPRTTALQIWPRLILSIGPDVP